MAKQANPKNYLKLRDENEPLNFGRLVAEDDPDLDSYYVSPETYLNRAMNMKDPSVFFVGPKGTGKSAILQMIRIRKEADKDRVIDITPDDLAFSSVANVEAVSPLIGEAGSSKWLFKSLWDYVLALEILRREHPQQNGFVAFFMGIIGNQHTKDAKRLLELSSQGTKQTLTGRILELIKEVQLSGEIQAAKMTGKLPDSKVQPLNLLTLVNSVARKLHESLHHPYYILIDDLDLHYEGTPSQNAFIAALFTTLRTFNKPPNVKCVVALRDNIYRDLPLDDRDKIHDWVVELEWTANNVKEMLEERIVAKLNVKKGDVWNGVFQKDGFKEIWGHSNGRPREAIRLATHCVTEARKEGHGTVQDEDMTKAVKKFSNERITEVASEHKKYHALEKIVRRFTGWPKEFDYKRLDALLEEIKLEIDVDEISTREYNWLGGYSNIQFAALLIESGFILYKASRTSEAHAYDHRYCFPITKDTWFALHNMFAPGLALQGV